MRCSSAVRLVTIVIGAAVYFAALVIKLVELLTSSHSAVTFGEVYLCHPEDGVAIDWRLQARTYQYRTTTQAPYTEATHTKLGIVVLERNVVLGPDAMAGQQIVALVAWIL